MKDSLSLFFLPYANTINKKDDCLMELKGLSVFTLTSMRSMDVVERKLR